MVRRRHVIRIPGDDLSCPSRIHRPINGAEELGGHEDDDAPAGFTPALPADGIYGRRLFGYAAPITRCPVLVLLEALPYRPSDGDFSVVDSQIEAAVRVVAHPRLVGDWSPVPPVI